MDISKIRLSRCSYNTDGEYWYQPEIVFVSRTWYGTDKECTVIRLPK